LINHHHHGGSTLQNSGTQKKFENLLIFDRPQPPPSMKRKRGPAPRGNKRKHKRELEEEKRQQSDSEVDDVIDKDEESFHGFSSDDEGQPGSQTLEDEDNARTAGPGNGHTAKKSKKSAPSKEELIDLLLRSSPFQSNLFKLQTEELLAEVRVKYDKMTKLETALHRLKEVIMAIPTSEEQLVDYLVYCANRQLHEFEVEMKSRHKIVVPFPTPAPSKDGLHKFKFLAPSSVKLIGSYALKATSKTSNGFAVDVSVAMPDVDLPNLVMLIRARISFRIKTFSIIVISISEHVISPPSPPEFRLRPFLFHSILSSWTEINENHVSYSHQPKVPQSQPTQFDSRRFK
jgi:hypothetical protein